MEGGVSAPRALRCTPAPCPPRSTRLQRPPPAVPLHVPLALPPHSPLSPNFFLSSVAGQGRPSPRTPSCISSLITHASHPSPQRAAIEPPVPLTHARSPFCPLICSCQLGLDSRPLPSLLSLRPSPAAPSWCRWQRRIFGVRRAARLRARAARPRGASLCGPGARGPAGLRPRPLYYHPRTSQAPLLPCPVPCPLAASPLSGAPNARNDDLPTPGRRRRPSQQRIQRRPGWLGRPGPVVSSTTLVPPPQTSRPTPSLDCCSTPIRRVDCRCRPIVSESRRPTCVTLWCAAGRVERQQAGVDARMRARARERAGQAAPARRTPSSPALSPHAPTLPAGGWHARRRARAGPGQRHGVGDDGGGAAPTWRA